MSSFRRTLARRARVAAREAKPTGRYRYERIGPIDTHVRWVKTMFSFQWTTDGGGAPTTVTGTTWHLARLLALVVGEPAVSGPAPM